MTESGSRFWEEIPLQELNEEQWESLCDGCARCCLHKLQHPETDEIVYTDVACRLLDLETCRCTSYESRMEHVAGCTDLRKMPLSMYRWLPVSCAYRRLQEGRGLPIWHPLLTNDLASVVHAKISIADWALAEADVPEEALEDHILDDPDLFE